MPKCSLIKKTVGKLFVYSGILKMSEIFSSRNNFSVLMYHRVSPNDFFNERLISSSPENFEWQMRFLSNHCNVISFDELNDILENKRKLPRNTVLITFDDGYKDNYEFAYPILKKYDLPATISIPTGYIHANKIFWWDEIAFLVKKTNKQQFTINNKTFSVNKKTIDALCNFVKYESNKNKLLDDLSKKLNVSRPKINMYLTWKQMNEMRKNKISFAPHTVNHKSFVEFKGKEAKKEVIDSRNMLKSKIHQIAPVFTYPYGDIKDTGGVNRSFLKKEGFKFSLSTTYGSNTLNKKTFCLKRIGVEKDDDLNMFKIKLRGMLSFISRIYLKMR